MFKQNIDIMLLSETKLDNTFKSSEFIMDGFHIPIRKDRDRNGGGLLLYINEDIAATELKPTIPDDIEAVFVELNLRSHKWLLAGLYKPRSQDNQYFLNTVLSSINHLNYDNVILLGDFNMQPSDECMVDFQCRLNVKNIVTEPTCFKSVNNPSCIDLILEMF